MTQTQNLPSRQEAEQLLAAGGSPQSRGLDIPFALCG